MGRQAIRIFYCSIGLYFTLMPSVNAAASYRDEFIYFCPNYDGIFQFYGNEIIKRFGPASLSDQHPTDNLVASVYDLLVDCSTPDMFCLKETQKRDDPDDKGRYVYAVPRIVKPGMKYSVAGWNFSTFSASHLMGSKQPIVVVVAEPIEPNPSYAGYKTYVEGDLGVKYLHYKKVMAAFYGSREADQAYNDISCTLQGDKGLFATVKVQRAPSCKEQNPGKPEACLPFN